MHGNCLLSKRQEKNSVLQEKTQKFSQKLNASEPRSTHRFQSDAQKKKPELDVVFIPRKRGLELIRRYLSAIGNFSTT